MNNTHTHTQGTVMKLTSTRQDPLFNISCFTHTMEAVNTGNSDGMIAEKQFVTP